MSRPRYVVVLDYNARDPDQWLVSRDADTFQEAESLREHDGRTWIVEQMRGDREVGRTVLINRYNGREDSGTIYRLYS
jgi:hypothetical protein